MRGIRRQAGFIALIAAVLLGSAVTGTPVSAATADPNDVSVEYTSTQTAAATHHSVAATRSWLVGKYYGPNAYTNNYRSTLTGSHMIYNSAGCPTYRYGPDSKGTYYSPAITSGTPVEAAGTSDSAAGTATGPTSCPSGTSSAAQPNSWWNPGSWDWGHILSAAWNKIWNGCIKGAASAVTATATGNVGARLLIRGARIAAIGPEGYAALAIGGCFVGLVF